MATYLVQLTNDPEPRPFYEVDPAEYERLLDLGLVVNAPADPTPPDLFDQEMADELLDTTSASYAAGRAQFTLRATTLPPSNPAVGDVWIT